METTPLTFDDKSGFTPEQQAEIAAHSSTTANPDPGLPGELGKVATVASSVVQIDGPAATLATLVTAASCVQGHFDVETLERPKPPSLYGFIQLPSGERKSALFSRLMKGCWEWQREQWERDKLEKDAWRATPKDERPSEPPAGKDRLFENATIEALVNAMARTRAAALWTSSEAGLITGGHNMTPEKRMGFFTTTNRLWDGDAYSSHRVGTGDVRLSAPRLSLLFAAQEEAARALFGNHTASDSGLVARFLVVKPKPLAGTRALRRPAGWELSTLEEFQEATKRWLSKPMPETPLVLPLTEDARAALEGYYSEIEAGQGKGGAYEDFKATASKSPEMACRIACTLACWRGDDTTSAVALDDMNAAIDLARYYLKEAQAFMGGATETQASRDMDLMLGQLKAAAKGAPQVSRRDLERNLKAPFRGNPDRTSKALADLKKAGWIDQQEGQRGGAIYTIPD